MVWQQRYSFLELPDTASTQVSEQIKTAGAQAIDRILVEVGKGFTIPHDLDRESLRTDIGYADITRDHAFDLLGGSKAAGRLKHIRRIRGAAEKLVKLLKADADIDAMFTAHLPKLPENPYAPPFARRPLDQLNQMLDAIAPVERGLTYGAHEWRTAHKRDPALRGRRPTGEEWLAGVSLPLLFEWHFRERAGRSRTKEGKPSGPTVRFISATMKELELRYSDESIVRAFSRLAPHREKQRNRKDHRRSRRNKSAPAKGN